MLSQVVFLCLLAPVPDATGEPPLPSFTARAPAAIPSPAARAQTPSPADAPADVALDRVFRGPRAGDAFSARVGHIHMPVGVCSLPVPFPDTLTRDVAAGLGYPVGRSLVAKGDHHWARGRAHDDPTLGLERPERRTGDAAVSVATIF